MAITRKAGKRLTGLSTDFQQDGSTTTTADGSEQNGTTFMQTDTVKELILNYGDWAETNQPSGSIGELLNDYSSVRNQHFWYFFSGSNFSNYASRGWTYTDVTGVGTGGMVNAVNGGFSITTGGGANRESNISFNDKRQYSPTGSVVIWVAKATATSGSDVHLGFSNDATSASYQTSDHQANWEIDGGTQYLLTTGGSGATSTPIASGTAMGSDFRVGKIVCGATTISLSIDGVLEATNSANLPSEIMQPKFSVYGNAKTGSVTYCEAYNT